MKKFFENLAIITSIPITYLNAFSGIVSFVWLGIIGNWFLVAAGIVSIFISSLIIGFAMMPALGVQVVGVKLLEKKQKLLGIICFYLATIMNMAVISFWVLYVYYFGLINISSQSHILPVTIWAYSVSVGPINYMASKEGPDSIATFYMTFFTSLGCLLNTILISFFDWSLFNSMVVFLICMSICLNIMFYDAYYKIKL